jgi:serine/threonine-protein kinase
MIEPGTVVGAFRVEGVIGKGGMASVYRAVQVRLDRPVALKVLEPMLALDEQFVERFKIEGINAARLDHPNIVPVFEAGEDGGYVFLAMKLVDGESLSSLIARRRTLSCAELVPTLKDIAHALDYAHKMGFVHRDVKPGNVLIDRGGHVFLSDFGLSKNMGTRGITGTGQWMGTAEYMAPEQASGGALDYRADLYAMGCMAFECLTSDPPFLADNPFAVMLAHATAEIPSASERIADLPPGIDEIFRRAMAKQPEDRYPAALAFVESLQAAAESRTLTTDAEPASGYRSYAGPMGAPAPADVARNDDVPSFPSSSPPRTSEQPQAPSTSESNMFCPRCIGPVEHDDLFCGGCGERMLWCNSCRGPRIESDRFCPHCGATSEPGAPR